MEPKTIFVIAVTTARMIMPGLPAMQKIPGMNMPDLSAPKRTLTMSLTSDQKIDKWSKAECAAPEGLKIGPKAALDIAFSQSSDGGAPGFESSSKNIDSTMKISADMKRATERDQRARSSIRQGLDNQSGSYAYWPGRDAKEIVADSACPGSYALTTNYCGNTSITFDKPQDFLAPIDLTSLGKSAGTAKSIKVAWKSIPNAKGYLVTAMGSKDKLMVIWTSASKPDVKLDFAASAIPVDKFADYIKDGVLLPPDVTSCDIPIAIFNKVGNAMLSVTAFGADKVQKNDGIETQVVIRSTAISILGSIMSMGNTKDDDTLRIKDGSKTDKNDNAAEAKRGKSDNNGENTLDKVDDALNKAIDAKDKVDGIINKTRGLFRW